MTRLLLCLCLCLSPLGAQAQDRDLAVGLGTWTTLRTTTMIVNLRCFDAGTCQEQNPVFAHLTDRPLLLSSLQVGLSAAGTYSLWSLRRTHPTLARWLTWSLVGLSGAVLVHDIRATRSPGEAGT
jgi:hypothetical protein